MTSYDYPHNNPDCTGIPRRQSTYWLCDGCMAYAYDLPEVEEAVRVERAVGEMARLLAQQGRDLTPG